MARSRAMEGSSASSSSPPLEEEGELPALGTLSTRSGGVTLSFQLPCGEEPGHFLDACFLCRRPLGRARDIFMYRGDTPFCSEEFRQEQIELDEAREEEEAGPYPDHPRPGTRTAETAMAG